MTRLRYLSLLLLLCTLLASLGMAAGLPSTSFTKHNDDWYDSWNIDRNYYGGSNGYLPDIAYETLGSNAELAYSIGQHFNSTYSSRTEKAEAILSYVQQWTEYGYDEDNVFMEGKAQDEWAWNADEMAHAFNETTGVTATGDCEDMAFLCATIYKGAGFDAAVVDAPEHVALLIWLPEYPNANSYWDISDDNRDHGWIWVEATGSTNPLGWTPPDFDNGDWIAYPIGELQPVTEQSQPISFDYVIVAAVVILIFAALIGASKSRRTTRSYLPPPPPP